MKHVRWFAVLLLVILTGFVAVPQAAQAQTITVTPEVGPPGTLFAFYAEGFIANEKVGVWINNPDGSVSSVVDSKGDILVVQTSDRGLAEWYIDTLDTATPGFYSMVARGLLSGVEYVIPFQIDPGAPVTPPIPARPNSRAEVQPSVGPPGTAFEFFANGFFGGEPVGVWINNPDGSVSSIRDIEGEIFIVYADDEGRARWIVAISPEAQPGFYQLVARGIDSGITHVIPFQVQ